MPAPEASEDLVDRLRRLLAGTPRVREVSMFGGRSFMVDDRMVVSARKGGRLLVRVAPERHEELLDRPGAAPAEMGRGRRMGVGWIEVAAEATSEDERLLEWVRIALSHDPRERTTSP